MTIVPLVVALIVTGIAASAEAARAGRLTARALVTFVALLWAASALAALVTPVLPDLFPIPGGAAAGLADALAYAGPVGENAPFRSEEQTPELQYLMRISYATSRLTKENN